MVRYESSKTIEKWEAVKLPCRQTKNARGRALKALIVGCASAVHKWLQTPTT